MPVSFLKNFKKFFVRNFFADKIFVRKCCPQIFFLFFSSYCPKRFTQKSHVDQHERIHTGSKPFACQFCGRQFRQRSQQLGHEATHLHRGDQRVEVFN